jgi:hypothetical protein
MDGRARLCVRVTAMPISPKRITYHHREPYCERYALIVMQRGFA